MRSAFLVLSACAAVSHAFSDSSACDDADASSLLQSRKSVHVQRAQNTDANDLLRSLRDVATSFTEGSAVTMTPADVNAAMGTANTALHTMLPLLEQQHALAQQEIRHALAAVQTCHNEHGGEVRARLEQAVIREVVEKDGCEETLNDAIEAEHEACAGQGDNPNCLCDEARIAITDQTALCVAVTELYEAVYCELQVSCSAFQQCHADEMEVYSVLRADIEAAMTSRQEEYRTFMQVDCLMNLITTAMLSGTPIDHSSLVACDDVSVDHLAINFPVPPSAPTGCPAPQSSAEVAAQCSVADLCDESEWPDLDHGLVCSDCKVLVNRFNSHYKTCNGYCETMGRACEGAWEETGDTCTVQHDMTCDQELPGSSDALCQCSAEVADLCDESQWPDLDHGLVCGDCKVLVNRFNSHYGTCNGYCDTIGRACVGAWEETGDTCTVQHTMTCDQTIGSSDAICECSAEVADLCDESEWHDLDHGLVCSDCKVLVNRFNSHYKTCNGYCETMGRACEGAWEETGDTCTVQHDMTCDQELPGSSDALCQCSSEVTPSD